MTANWNVGHHIVVFWDWNRAVTEKFSRKQNAFIPFPTYGGNMSLGHICSTTVFVAQHNTTQHNTTCNINFHRHEILSMNNDCDDDDDHDYDDKNKNINN